MPTLTYHQNMLLVSQLKDSNPTYPTTTRHVETGHRHLADNLLAHFPYMDFYLKHCNNNTLANIPGMGQTSESTL